MFGMSMTEIIIIAVVALILIGPKELPNVARTLGKTLRDVRKAGDDLRDSFEREVMQEPKPPVGPPPEAIAAVSPVARLSGAQITEQAEKQGDAHAAPQAESAPAHAEAPATQETKGAA